MAGATAWKQLKHLRHRDLLLGTLLRAFERDQMECRVLQSEAFRPHLTRWAELLVARGASGAQANPQEVPAEILEGAKQSSAEVRWLLRRLSGDRHHRGLPHFPSTLLQRGPQYPFQPFELTYLRSVVGGIRGTELVQKLDLPEPTDEAKARAEEVHRGAPVRDLWAEGCLDDDDHRDPSKPPR
ncbi:SBNO1 [Symbiodinium pilosum]|uniref:SBNO1 protein n=1 Tax=Symbiodinium pilosum TaxID=2952 RepID=A0A812YIF0_SYMPI|nr:SBNO1 [Symbiodinium pilosum]